MLRILPHSAALAALLVLALFAPSAFAVEPKGTEAAGKTPPGQDRNRYKEDLAGNEQVEQVIKGFRGKGEVGDDSKPTPPADALKDFQVHEDLKLERVASEPAVCQPLQMSWDHRGRLWVVQYLQYPFPAGLKIVKYDQYLRAVFDKTPEPPPHHVHGADKVTVLEDTNGDGSYDKIKDVLTGLNIVSAVTTGHGGIWVLNPPYLLFYPDANGDDVPDGDPQVHLRGFGLEDTHSVANSLKWGPDGWLYGANGSTTTGVVSSSVTKDVHFKGQMIWRYHPVSHVFEIFAEGGGNTFSLEIDRTGRTFSGTNAGSTRGMHYVQGSYAEKNWGKHGELTNPYAFGFFHHMPHQGFKERFSQAFAIYNGGVWPAKFDGFIISADSLHNRVLASELLPETSTYRTVDMPPLVTTKDRWFRPVDCELGPDGAIYLADWYDTRLTHVDPRDNWHKTSGRIYRLQAKEAPRLAPFDLARMTNAQLIARLGDRNRWFRQQAVRILAERHDSAVLPELTQIATATDEGRSLEALWTIYQLGGLNDELALKLLAHPNADMRRWTVRLLGDANEVASPVAARLADLAAREPDVSVRSQLASTAKRLPAAAGLPIVRQLMQRDEDVTDLHLPLLVWWALESKIAADRTAVLALFQDRSLWQRPIVDRYLLERLMQRFAVSGSPDDLQTCAQLLELSPGNAQTARLMAGLLEAYRGRRMTGLPETLVAGIEQYQRSSGKADLALSLRLGMPAAIGEALKIVADEKADKTTRTSYVEILGQIQQPRIVAPLLALLDTTSSHTLKRTVLQALLNYDDPTIGPALLRLYDGPLVDEQGVRSTAQRVLASRKSWAALFLGEVDAGRISPRSVPLEIVQQMMLHEDETIKRLIAKHWGKIRGGTPVEKQQQIQQLVKLIRAGHGDLQAGKLLFTKSCANCHTLFDEGGKAGPILTGYERDNLDFMLLAIVDPSAAIREEFTNFAIVTGDGRNLTGLIVDQNTRTVTLRGVDNQTTLIDRDDIELLRALPTSIMPDGLLNSLSNTQILDLFAYLMSRPPKARP